jgi:hypothetical protein
MVFQKKVSAEPLRICMERNRRPPRLYICSSCDRMKVRSCHLPQVLDGFTSRQESGLGDAQSPDDGKQIG